MAPSDLLLRSATVQCSLGVVYHAHEISHKINLPILSSFRNCFAVRRIKTDLWTYAENNKQFELGLPRDW